MNLVSQARGVFWNIFFFGGIHVLFLERSKRHGLNRISTYVGVYPTSFENSESELELEF